jgi:hypothetical protein
MPFDTGVGKASCLALLAQVRQFDPEQRRDQLRRHAETCECLRADRVCPICWRLSSLWFGLSTPATGRRHAA